MNSSAAMTAERDEQVSLILSKSRLDMTSLHALSRLPGGFMTDGIRSRVWVRIFNIKSSSSSSSSSSSLSYCDYIEEHRDSDQIRADVERSLWNYKEMVGMEEDRILMKRQILSNIIMALVCKHKNQGIHYYQGFHDIVSVVMLVLGEQNDRLLFDVAESMSFTFFSDCLHKDFDRLSKVMVFVMMLIQATDNMLYQYLMLAKIEPFFATSWVLTWFAHDVKSYRQAARVFDVLLCSHPIYSLYLSAALVMHFRQQVFRCDCEFAAIHNMLVHLPQNFGLPIEEIIPIADCLYESIPPSKLKKMATGELKSLINKNRVKMLQKPTYTVPVESISTFSLSSRFRSISLNSSSSTAPTNAGRNGSSFDSQLSSSDVQGRITPDHRDPKAPKLSSLMKPASTSPTEDAASGLAQTKAKVHSPASSTPSRQPNMTFAVLPFGGMTPAAVSPVIYDNGRYAPLPNDGNGAHHSNASSRSHASEVDAPSYVVRRSDYSAKQSGASPQNASSTSSRSMPANLTAAPARTGRVSRWRKLWNGLPRSRSWSGTSSSTIIQNIPLQDPSREPSETSPLQSDSSSEASEEAAPESIESNPTIEISTHQLPKHGQSAVFYVKFWHGLVMFWVAIVGLFSRRSEPNDRSTDRAIKIAESDSASGPVDLRFILTFLPRVIVSFWSVVMLEGCLTALRRLPELFVFEWSKKTV